MKIRDLADLTLLAALWGASFLLMKISAPEFGAVPMMTVRIALAGLFLLPFVFYKKQQAVLVKNIIPITVVGVFSSAIPFSLLAYATLYLSAGYTSILNATTPMFAALIAFFWMKLRLTVSAVIGLVIGFLGVVLLVWEKLSLNYTTSGFAILAGLGAAACYGVAANYTKKSLAGISVLAITGGSLLSAAILMLPFAVYWWPEKIPSIRSWMNVVILALACTGFAQVLYFRLIERVGPANATTVTFLIPVFSLIWGYLFLSELVSFETLLACSVILLGTGLTTGLLLLPKRQTKEA
ncbi:DMT family transporter [Aliikangiella sp. IMCC44359]|uniref:DMT family transporter n=1 Tax=Aliikangiella sp. IMCC44359 TaxID=3459125 RepID=UPI00403AF878